MGSAKIVDLFAGPGGLDVAAEKLDLSSVGVEWDSGACETRRGAGLATRQGDVRDFGPSDFPDATILAGGPPCQTFTVAGSGAGRRALDDVLKFVERMASAEDPERIKTDLKGLDDERTGLVLEPLRWILEAVHTNDLVPYETIILEQVPAVLPVWTAYRSVLEQNGYFVDHGVLKTETYGVPQTRRRAVLIASRSLESITLPEPTHHAYRKGLIPPVAEGGRLRSWVSMGEALGRGSSPFYVVSNYGTGGDPKARGRRESTLPSTTVTGKIFRNRLYDMGGTELERFTHAEAGRLQSFPPDYPWSGNDVGQQIGNAVPPLMAMHVICAALGRVPDEKEIEALGSWRARQTWMAAEPFADTAVHLKAVL